MSSLDHHSAASSAPVRGQEQSRDENPTSQGPRLHAHSLPVTNTDGGEEQRRVRGVANRVASTHGSAAVHSLQSSSGRVQSRAGLGWRSLNRRRAVAQPIRPMPVPHCVSPHARRYRWQHGEAYLRRGGGCGRCVCRCRRRRRWLQRCRTWRVGIHCGVGCGALGAVTSAVEGVG